MARLRITGWRVGLQKVSMTKSIQCHSGMSLRNAKDITDAVLEGRTVELTDLDNESAAALADELDHLGADACVVDDAA